MNITSKQLMRLSLCVYLSSLVWYLPQIVKSPLCIVAPFIFVTTFLYCQKEHNASKPYFSPPKPLLCLYALWAVLNMFLHSKRFCCSLKITVMRFSPGWFLSGVVVIIAIYLLTRSRPLKTVVRMAEIIYPFSVFVIILFFVMLIPFASKGQLFTKAFSKNAFDLSAMTCITAAFSPLFLPILMGKKAELSFSRAMRYTSFLAFIHFVYILAFSLLPSLRQKSIFSLFTLSKAVNVLGVLERPEGLCVIVGAFLFLLSALFYTALFCYLTKEISGKKTKLFTAIVSGAVFTISSADTSAGFLSIEIIFSYINIVFCFFIPLVIMLAFAIKNLRGEEKC